MIVAVVDDVRRRRPRLEVVLAWLGHDSPDLAAALRAHPGCVVVPLLLSRGYHVRADVVLAAAEAGGVVVAAPLGPDRRLAAAMLDRLEEAHVPSDAGVVVAAAGSRDPRAASDVRMVTDMLRSRRAGVVEAGFLSAGTPHVAAAVQALAPRPVAVATYLLGPGRFQRALGATGARWIAEPLGHHPLVSSVVLERYDAVEARSRLR